MLREGIKVGRHGSRETPGRTVRRGDEVRGQEWGGDGGGGRLVGDAELRWGEGLVRVGARSGVGMTLSANRYGPGNDTGWWGGGDGGRRGAGEVNEWGGAVGRKRGVIRSGRGEG